MRKFGMFIAKNRIAVLIVSVLLMIPSFYGFATTRINYDLLTYLPEDVESVKGEKILNDTFSSAATGMLVIENMPNKDIVKIKDSINNINGVKKAIWADDLVDLSVPKEILPDKIKDVFFQKDSTLIIIQFKEGASSDTTQQAIEQIRSKMNKQCFLSGTSAIVKDTIELSNRETPKYIIVAVILASIVLALTLNSSIVPVIFLLSTGIAILYNFGTNKFLGEISYVTQALAAVLQLGVTMDYSIFLLHRYEEELERVHNKNEAMATAISAAATAISGSSLTTIAGFLALVTMKLRLGTDIGLVMAKGVLIGVISTMTILPAMILTFDNLIHRFNHGTVLPEFKKLSAFVVKHHRWFIAASIILLIPAFYGQSKVNVYYNLDESLPKDMPSIISLKKLKNDFNMATTHMIVVDDNVAEYKIKNMADEIKNVEGITAVLSTDQLIGPVIPEDFIPSDLMEAVKKDGYKLLVANSKYKPASDELNSQIHSIKQVIKKYDANSLLTGEGALTKDLIEISDIDFKNVNIASIAAIFVIVAAVFTSLSIPALLVCAIELAIFINMAIPYYTGQTIPFIASIVIGCIQLGSTVDYAILLSSSFREQIRNGVGKMEAMQAALQSSSKSIVTSALTFFGSTVGVGIISHINLLRTLTLMLARGAIISMLVILFILPSILLLFEPLIAKSSINWQQSTIGKIKSRIAEGRN